MLLKRNLLRMMLSVRKASSVSFKSFAKIEESGKYVLLTIPVVTFGLGTWQISRRNWKLNLIEELQAKSRATPVDLLQNLDKLQELEYCPVHTRGVFDHSKEIYIGPRSLISQEGESQSAVFSSRSSSGYYVVTPFKLTDKDMTILVNRGWVPKSKLPPKSRQEGQVTGEVGLVGTVRLTEKRPVFSAKKTPGSKLFLFRDIDAIAAKCGTSPVFLDASFETTVPGGPQGGQTRVTLRNEHLSYIVIWYGLSAATSWLWYKKYIQRIPLM